MPTIMIIVMGLSLLLVGIIIGVGIGSYKTNKELKKEEIMMLGDLCVVYQPDHSPLLYLDLDNKYEDEQLLIQTLTENPYVELRVENIDI